MKLIDELELFMQAVNTKTGVRSDAFKATIPQAQKTLKQFQEQENDEYMVLILSTVQENIPGVDGSVHTHFLRYPLVTINTFVNFDYSYINKFHDDYEPPKPTLTKQA